jgi:ATP-dependent DNA helicase RecG
MLALSRALNIKPDTVKEYINRLKEKNILKRIGPDRGGHWEILD